MTGGLHALGILRVMELLDYILLGLSARTDYDDIPGDCQALDSNLFDGVGISCRYLELVE